MAMDDEAIKKEVRAWEARLPILAEGICPNCSKPVHEVEMGFHTYDCCDNCNVLFSPRGQQIEKPGHLHRGVVCPNCGHDRWLSDNPPWMNEAVKIDTIRWPWKCDDDLGCGFEFATERDLGPIRVVEIRDDERLE